MIEKEKIKQDNIDRMMKYLDSVVNPTATFIKYERDSPTYWHQFITSIALVLKDIVTDNPTKLELKIPCLVCGEATSICCPLTICGGCTNTLEAYKIREEYSNFIRKLKNRKMEVK